MHCLVGSTECREGGRGRDFDTRLAEKDAILKAEDELGGLSGPPLVTSS